MLTTVKQEDRLVARGANPRTGLISPFVKIETTRSDYVGVADDVFVVPPALPTHHHHQHHTLPAGAAASTGPSQSPRTTTSPPQHSRRTSSGGHWRANSASWGFVGPGIDVDPLKYDPVPGSNHVSAVTCGQKTEKDLPQIYVEDLDDRPTRSGERRGHLRSRSPEPIRIFEDRAVSQTISRPIEPLISTTSTAQQTIQQASAMKIPRKQVGSASPPRQFQQPVGGVVPSGDLRSHSAPCWPSQIDGSGSSFSHHGRPISPVPKGPRVQDTHKNMFLGPKTMPPTWDAPQPPRGPRTARRAGPVPSPVAGQRLPRVRIQTHQGHHPGPQPCGVLEGARKVPPSLRTGMEKRNAIEEMASFGHMSLAPSSPTRPNIRRREEQAVTMQEVAKPHSVENSPVSKIAQQLPVSRSNPDLRPIAPHLNGGMAGYRPPMQPRNEVKMTVEPVVSDASQSNRLPPRIASPVAQSRPKEIVTRPRIEKPRVSFDVTTPEKINVAPGADAVQTEKKPAEVRADPTENASRKGERMSPNRDPVKRAVVSKPAPSPTIERIVESPLVEGSAAKIEIREEPQSKPGLRRRRSVVERAKHVATLLHSLDKSWAASSAKWEHIRSLLWLLTCHVTSTLIHALVAVQVLTDPDKPMREYAIATRDVGLALTYLVALYQVCRAAMKMLAMLVGAVYYIWHPVVGIATVFRWFMVD